ncbi:nitrous oxide reductase family maturation protein NosD [Zobellella iuensis]|uniref:Nitrous oxide reductase family maturation protein NosD n=1 Tax=Zobellella iuensis TaxID=2803811 RepID=A0ABS1QSC5_9GAMM|nr:nitrous oxide reductase family maturation protein NosD [Zobellella iuensis]MBL1377745.1 nitrous oxide reductase family maturation protein NosD [Zobellella iuensis]
MNRLWLFLLLLAWPLAAEVRLTPASVAGLAEVPAGETVRLAPGIYPALRIGQPLTLLGEPGAVIDAGGQGHGLYLDAPGIQVSHLEVRNWGKDLGTLDAGVFISDNADGTEVAHLRLRGPGFGIWADRVSRIRLYDNDIEGDHRLRSQDRGNGIHLFNVGESEVAGNRIRRVRDGIYIDYSNHNRLAGNHLSELRYGIHYMYSNHNEVVANYTRETRTGYALMQSRFLTVVDNVSEQDENYGILMNYITYSTISNNRVAGVRANSHLLNPRGAEGKALFAYHVVGNEISGNWLGHSDLGIHMTAGSEQNRIFGNALVGNRTQVRYVSNRSQEWSHQGQGNYWSDYQGWDLNQDGLGDIVHEPNDGMDRVLWQYPAARWLMNAPVVNLLRWIQQQFPVFKGSGVRDSFPLMGLPEARRSHEYHSLTTAQ